MITNKNGELSQTLDLTERELGQLMVLLSVGDLEERAGFNMSVWEQCALGERCRKAVWEIYNYRRMNGMPTELDKTGVLEPKRE